MSVRLLSPGADRRLLGGARGSRTMIWILAIMLFLTVLAAALGLGARGAQRLLDRQLAGRLTVQIVDPVATSREAGAIRALALLRGDAAVARAVPVDRAQLAALVRPWLGTDAADPDLPLPAMIDVDLNDPAAATVSRITTALTAAVPDARIDRPERWMSPISTVMASIVAFAAGLVLLMAAATAAVVLLATRLGLDTHRATLDVLHNLGSTDLQVARLFQRRVALDAFVGGAIGMAAALGVLAVAGSELDSLGSELLAGVALAPRDWAVLAALPFAFALLATLAARVAVLTKLRRVL